MSQEYRVPENVTRVERTRQDIRRVVIHDRVTDIASDAFRGWAGLAEVVFKGKSSLERIGSHAFAGTGLKVFIAPGSLKTIRAGAFAGCKNLKEVRLNEGLESLGDGVFQDSGVVTIYIPLTLQRMRKDTFAGCQSLRRVEVAEGCKLGIRYYLPQNVEVVTVSARLPPAEDELSSDFDESDLDDTIVLQENGDETMQKLQE